MALFGCRELINIGGMVWMIWIQWHGGQCRYLLYDMDMEQTDLGPRFVRTII